MSQTPAPPAVLDRRLEAIAHRDRRAILYELLDRPSGPDGTLDLEAAVEASQASMVDAYHRHVPKLADCELVRWDADDRTVTRGPAFGAVRPLLERLETSPFQDVGQ